MFDAFTLHKSFQGDCPLFINICEWNKIPEPKSDEHPIPVTGGHMYEGKDQNGERFISISYQVSHRFPRSWTVVLLVLSIALR